MPPFFASAPDWFNWAFYGVWLGPHSLAVLMGRPKLALLVLVIHLVLITAQIAQVLIFGGPFGAVLLQVSVLLFVPVALVSGYVSYILALGVQRLYAKRKT